MTSQKRIWSRLTKKQAHLMAIPSKINYLLLQSNVIEMIFTENDKYLKFDLNMKTLQIINETLDYDP